MLKHRKRIISTESFQPSRLRSGKEVHQEDDERRKPTTLAVAFACRDLYHEVSPMYYSGNIFLMKFDGGCVRHVADLELAPYDKLRRQAEESLGSFLEAIGANDAALIESFCFEFRECNGNSLWLLSQVVACRAFLAEFKRNFPGKTRLLMTVLDGVKMMLGGEKQAVIWTPAGRMVMSLDNPTIEEDEGLELESRTLQKAILEVI